MSVAFSPDSRYLATGSVNGEVRLWQAEKWQPVLTLHGHRDWVWSLAFSPDGSLLASSSEDRTVRLWEVESGQCLAILRDHIAKVWSVAFSPDGHLLASGSTDQLIQLWEVAIRAHEHRRSYRCHKGAESYAAGTWSRRNAVWRCE